MNAFLMYNEDTFEILGIQTFPNNEEPISGGIRLEEILPLSCYYFVNGILNIRAEQPSIFHVWNNDSWVVDSQQHMNNLDENAKNKRRDLLQESDWTDTVSAVSRLGQEKYEEWQIYRQALRDITLQPGYPTTIVWPEKPI